MTSSPPSLSAKERPVPPGPVRRRSLRETTILGLQAAFCAFLLVAVSQQVSRNWEVIQAAPRPSLGWLSAATVVAAIGLIASSWICRSLLSSLKVQVTLAQATGLVYVPLLGKYLPGRGWSVPLSFWVFGRLGIPPATSAPCIGWSFLLSLSSSLLISAGMRMDLAYMAVWPLAIMLVFIGIFPNFLHRAAALVLTRFRRDTVVTYQFTRAHSCLLFAVNGLAWFIYGLGFYCLVSSIERVPLESAPALIGLFAFAQIAGFVAFFAPAGIGIREGVLLIGLSPLVGEVDAAAIAVFCRLWQTVLELALAALGWQALRCTATPEPCLHPDPSTPAAEDPAARRTTLSVSP